MVVFWSNAWPSKVPINLWPLPSGPLHYQSGWPAGFVPAERCPSCLSTARVILFILGTADPVMPYVGGRQPGGARVLSVEDAVKMWVYVNGCKEVPEVREIHELNNGPLVSVSTYGSCKKHGQVKLYRIEGGGHVWPGEPEDISRSGAAKIGRGIDASEEIWKFFESISKVEEGKYTS